MTTAQHLVIVPSEHKKAGERQLRSPAYKTDPLMASVLVQDLDGLQAKYAHTLPVCSIARG